MNQIKNLKLLAGFQHDHLDLMEQAALMHRRHNNITFKIVEVNDKKVIIQAVQGKSNGEYFPQKRLVEMVHETFDRFFPGKVMNVHAVPYQESPANSVDIIWINEQMKKTGTKLKDLSADTGINYTHLSGIISGSELLSQPVKALMWYYFQAKDSA